MKISICVLARSLGLSDPDIIRKYWNFPVEVDLEVDDGDTVEVGGLTLTVVHLPGHCPGMVGLFNPHSGILYSADIMHYPTPLGPYPIGNAKAHWASIQKCLQLNPEMLLEGHGLSAYSKDSSRRRLLHMERQQKDTRHRILYVLQRESRPMTTTDLVPEVLPVKSELDYAVSTGIGMRRCYAECCIQTHLLWHIEDGHAERVKEKGLVSFTATPKGRDIARAEHEERRAKGWS